MIKNKKKEVEVYTALKDLCKEYKITETRLGNLGIVYNLEKNKITNSEDNPIAELSSFKVSKPIQLDDESLWIEEIKNEKRIKK